MERKKTKPAIRHILILLVLILFLSAGVGLFIIWHTAFRPNVSLQEKPSSHFYIRSDSSYDDVIRQLEQTGWLKSTTTFSWLAEKKNYPARVLPGRYRITDGMSNNELINLLRSGRQDPVQLTFNNVNNAFQLAGRLAEYIEADSASIIRLLTDTVIISEYGFSAETAVLMFLPDTYEFFWNTSAEQLLRRMQREYQRFWNDTRLEQAQVAGFTPMEIAILASIVQRETSKPDEMSRIAGVFMNRLQRGMPLQADPTVIHAIGEPDITRVLNHHLRIDSPYNTYLYAGLPPGPITIPEPRTIDKVLQYEEHHYLYFCALDDFSGYHAFARTYSEHLSNARRYQQALNRKRIMR
jgi:UPF0755 protein